MIKITRRKSLQQHFHGMKWDLPACPFPDVLDLQLIPARAWEVLRVLGGWQPDQRGFAVLLFLPKGEKPTADLCGGGKKNPKTKNQNHT